MSAATAIAWPRSSFAHKSRRLQLDWPSSRSFKILSIDGGGIKGIFPAAALAELEVKHLGGASIASYFDMIVGTSTGGIISLGLGAGLTAQQMLRLYVEHGQEIFPPGGMRRWWLALRALALYRYDRQALSRAIAGVLANALLAESKVRLCIPSFEGHHGEVYIFKTPHHPLYRLDGAVHMRTIGEATSAAPTYFQSLDSHGYRFIDGGVWANNPIMIGVVDAMACFALDPSQIKILSLGCGRGRSTIGPWQAIGGLWSWRKIIVAAMDLQSQNAMGQACMLTDPNTVIRLEPEIARPIALDDWSRANAELPSAAKAAIQAKVSAIRDLFLNEPAAKPIFYWPPKSS